MNLPPETLKAMQAAVRISPETLKAMQAAVRISPETLKAMQAAVRISPETLKALEQLSSRELSSVAATYQLLAAREAHRLETGAGSAGEEAALRYQRALRNAVVHAPVELEARPRGESGRETPSPRGARQERVRRMAPPRAWPNSREARRVRRAAMAKGATDALVLATDIRHSTNLMNEAVDQHVFAATLEGFVASSRECIWRNRGWCANFTGDGFLAFWPITDGTRIPSVRRALAAISQLFAEFEGVHIPRFASNSRRFREDTGLCVGLDHGTVAIVEVGEEATIVGMPVVGATRLVSVGFEWEVLANNHLGVILQDALVAGSLPGVDIEQVVVTTKDFEALRAFSIQYEWTQRPLRTRQGS